MNFKPATNKEDYFPELNRTKGKGPKMFLNLECPPGSGRRKHKYSFEDIALIYTHRFFLD